MWIFLLNTCTIVLQHVATGEHHEGYTGSLFYFLQLYEIWNMYKCKTKVLFLKENQGKF